MMTSEDLPDQESFRALLFFSHPSQSWAVEQCIARSSACGIELAVLAVSETSARAERMSRPSWRLTEFIEGDAEAIDRLGRMTMKTQEMISESLRAGCGERAFFRRVSLWECLLPDISQRFTEPMVQAVYAFDRATQALAPQEVQVSSSARWPSIGIVFDGAGPTWMNYTNLLPILLSRVADRHGIKIRYFRATLSERLQYLSCRLLRKPAFLLYRMVRWMLKPTATMPISQPEGEINESKTVFLIRSEVGVERFGPVMDSIGEESSICFLDIPLSAGMTQTAYKNSSHMLAGRWRFLCSLAETLSLRIRMRRHISRLAFSDALCLGISYRDCLVAVLGAYTCELTEAHAYVAAFSEALAQIGRSVWVVANDQSIAGYACVRTCQAHSMPSLLIQHGLLSDPPVKMPIATHVAVPCLRDADILLRWGFPKERTTVVGFPEAKHIQQQKDTTDDAEQSAADHAVHPHLGITVITGPIPERRILAKLAERLAIELDVEVVVKVHPTERRDVYEKMLQSGQAGSLVRIEHRRSMHEILQETRILISYDSTVVVEAMLMEIPVIVVPLLLRADVVEHPIFADHPGLTAVEHVTARRVSELLHMPSVRRDFLEKQATYMKRILPLATGSMEEEIERLHDKYFSDRAYGDGNVLSSG